MAILVDLKATFDSMSRGGLRKRLEKESISIVIAEGENSENLEGNKMCGENERNKGEGFWTKKEARQKCPLTRKVDKVLIANRYVFYIV